MIPAKVLDDVQTLIDPEATFGVGAYRAKLLTKLSHTELEQ